MKQYLLLNLLASLFCVFSVTGGQSEIPENSFSVTVKHRQIVFTQTGDLHSITSNNPENKTSFSFYGDKAEPFIELYIPDNHFIDSCIKTVPVHFSQVQTDSSTQINCISDPFMGNIFYEKHYTISKKNHLIELSYKISGDTANTLLKQCSVQLIMHPLTTEEDPLKFVNINKKTKKVSTLPSTKSDLLSSDLWIGVRTRFRVILFTSNQESATPTYYQDNTLVIGADHSKTDDLNLKMYCGPVRYEDLRSAGDECTRLLYPLWFWMRWLSIGLMILFNSLLKIFGNVVISIVALSICVKIMIAPLFKIANKWQKQVNLQNARLQPRLNEIKLKYKGEEQNKQTFALYKELGISPLYSLKSLLSAAIQIPVFFAAYHMLSEHITLNEVTFLWIHDLSFPDHLIKLPFSIPYVGDYLNILPFVMTSITFASSWIHTDHSLSQILRRKQRKNLYMMASIFFVLLYNSPAGMVIYWTMNNLLAFFSTLLEQNFYPKKNCPPGHSTTSQNTLTRTQETIGS